MVTLAEALARYMYARQADTFEASPGEADHMWDTDHEVRWFWCDEAAACIGFIDQWRGQTIAADHTSGA